MRGSPLRLFVLLTLSVLGLPGVLACGSDEGTRGLQPSHEVSAPASDAEDAMTEAERRRQQTGDLQKSEIESFDRAEDE